MQAPARGRLGNHRRRDMRIYSELVLNVDLVIEVCLDTETAELYPSSEDRYLLRHVRKLIEDEMDRLGAGNIAKDILSEARREQEA
jgi:hypothetical protein